MLNNCRSVYCRRNILQLWADINNNLELTISSFPLHFPSLCVSVHQQSNCLFDLFSLQGCICKLKAWLNINLPLWKKRFPINNSWFICGMDPLRSVYFGRKVQENVGNMKTFLTWDGLDESVSLPLPLVWWITLMQTNTKGHPSALQQLTQKRRRQLLMPTTSSCSHHNFDTYGAVNYWNSPAAIHLKVLMYSHSGG